MSSSPPRDQAEATWKRFHRLQELSVQRPAEANHKGRLAPTAEDPASLGSGNESGGDPRSPDPGGSISPVGSRENSPVKTPGLFIPTPRTSPTPGSPVPFLQRDPTGVHSCSNLRLSQARISLRACVVTRVGLLQMMRVRLHGCQTMASARLRGRRNAAWRPHAT